MEKLLLLIDSKKSWINQNILCISFFLWIYFREIWIFCIFGVYLFSRMPFKKNFCVYLILRNSRKYVHAKMSTLKVDKNRRLHFKLPSLHFKHFTLHFQFILSDISRIQILTFVFAKQRVFRNGMYL